MTGPSTAVSRWSSFFIRSEMYPRRQNVFFIQQQAPCCPPDMITRTEAEATPPPNSSLVLGVCYSLSLICQPDIRGHEAPHHHLAVTCHPHPAVWQGSFTCCCGDTGVERIPKKESAQKVDPGEEKSAATPAGVWKPLFVKVSRFYWAFCPWGLEGEVTFAHDIPYEPVHGYY